MTKQGLTVEQSFLNDLERSIEATAVKGYRKPSQFYKPSSMNCIRNMYYQRIGQEAEGEIVADYTKIGIVNSGSDIHVRIQTAIEEMQDNGYDCQYVDVADYVKEHKLKHLKIVDKQGMETKLRNKHLALSFLTDGIIRYKGKYYLLEVKTEISRKFYYRKEVDPYHYRQATAYCVSFGIKDVIFIYVNRDTLDMKSYMFTPTNEMKHDFVGLIEACESYVDKNEVPPKPKFIDSRTCSYCDYKNVCRRHGNG